MHQIPQQQNLLVANTLQKHKDMLQKEGPKYQYGKGCFSDGVLGAWIGSVCGLHRFYRS